MFEYFRFSLPKAVTEQLVRRLDQLSSSELTAKALQELEQFQKESETSKGVYVLYSNGKAAYAGKAEDLADRLQQHLRKLTGRRNIVLSGIGFKALLLDENWTTSANEDLLIDHFREKGECAWNGAGFGPKDPGKHRDGGEPSQFDREFPVRDDYPVEPKGGRLTVGDLLKQLKEQAPYLVRYEIGATDAAMKVDLSGVPRNVRDMALAVATKLGSEWQLMQFAHGFTLYKSKQSYQHGTRLFPS